MDFNQIQGHSSKGRTASRHAWHFRILYLSAGQRASSSCAGDSYLLSTETPAFIPPTLWPPNRPDLNPVDYKLWSVIQEQTCVYKVEGQQCRWAAPAVSRLSGTNLTSVLLTRQSSSGALDFVLASRTKVATLNTNFNILLRDIVSMNVYNFIKFCLVLTILDQLICRGIANYGTRCMLP